MFPRTKLRKSERNAKKKNKILFISFPNERNFDVVKVTKSFQIPCKFSREKVVCDSIRVSLSI